MPLGRLIKKNDFNHWVLTWSRYKNVLFDFAIGPDSIGFCLILVLFFSGGSLATCFSIIIHS